MRTYYLKHNLFLIFFILSFISANSSAVALSGYVDYTYISRLSNHSLINLPYRMASINIEKYNDNIGLTGNFALEYHLRNDSYFLGSSNPQDFLIDMRELYIIYSSNLYEFRIGKQIHTWGNVDDNSPLDNASGLDYYYMFFGGIERKIASLSASLDYYIGNLKLNAVFSPIHSTNRIPLGNDDFPIELPIYPDPKEIFSISRKPYEGGLYGTLSSNLGDISFCYFSGYDRTFNLTGVNVYSTGNDLSRPFIDIVYGYRKTEVFGVGFTFLNNWFTIRSDFGYFSTRDQNKSIYRASSRSSLNDLFAKDSLHFSYPLSEKADYMQSTIQFETELPLNIKFIFQYFMHDTLDYSSAGLPIDEEVNITNVEIDPRDLKPSNLFTPGMGVPIAILTNSALFFTLEKEILNNQLALSFSSIIDTKNYEDITGIPGSILDFNIKYSLLQDLDILVALTNVSGSSNHPEGDDYPFNRMEDFSHIRFELKYFF